MYNIARGITPDWLYEANEINLHDIPQVLTHLKGCLALMTELVDGQGVTAWYSEDKIHVKDRYGFYNSTSPQWRAVNNSTAGDMLRKYPTYAVQGVIIGKCYGGNSYGVDDNKFLLHDIFDTQNTYLSHAEMDGVIDREDLETVPTATCMYMQGTVEELEELARGKSDLYDGQRMGIVVRPWEDIYARGFGFTADRVSFKVLNPDYRRQEH